MATFAEDIEKAAGGEPIEAVVIGPFGWSHGGQPDEEAYGYDRLGRTPIAQEQKDIVLPWEQARPLLDYEYSRGYGAPECHAVTAWTATLVLWVTQYDGSTRISSAHRNPVDHVPDMPGG